MNPTDRPIPGPEVVLRADLSDYALLFQPLFDDLVGLTPVALATWRALDGRRTVAEVAGLVRAQFDGAPESVIEDVTAFLSSLERRGFVLTEPARPSPSPWPPPSPNFGRGRGLGEGEGFPLALADGSRFLIRAGDELAARVVAQFAAAASLIPASVQWERGVEVLVVTEGQAAPQDAADDGSICVIQAPGRVRERRSGEGRGAGLFPRPLSETEWLWQQLARLSAFIGKEAQARGGVLLHGALALTPFPPASLPLSQDWERGRGVKGGRGEGGILLAGRSGVGKTTACSRLPTPWRALCDDTTLVVRDDKGAYWAHPWPTWSRLFGEHVDDRWDVQAAVPLQAIFVIDQAAQDRAAPAGEGQAVGLLLELARQASRRLWVGGTPDEFRAFHAHRFENLCVLVQAIPVYLIDVSLDGAFWQEIERVVTQDRKDGSEKPCWLPPGD